MIVGVFFIALFGILSLLKIPVQLTPDVTRPQITVTTIWPGASPQEVEREIIEEQEEYLKSVEGLTRLTSESMDSNVYGGREEELQVVFDEIAVAARDPLRSSSFPLFSALPWMRNWVCVDY